MSCHVLTLPATRKGQEIVEWMIGQPILLQLTVPEAVTCIQIGEVNFTQCTVHAYSVLVLWAIVTAAYPCLSSVQIPDSGWPVMLSHCNISNIQKGLTDTRRKKKEFLEMMCLFCMCYKQLINSRVDVIRTIQHNISYPHRTIKIHVYCAYEPSHCH